MHDTDLSILRHFAAVRGVTLELLRMVPEEWLCRPNEGDWTPAHAFTHIAGGNCGWLAALGDAHLRIDDTHPPATRTEIEGLLCEARRRMVAFFGSSADDRMGKVYVCGRDRQIGRDVLLYLTSHEVHHRARIVASLWQWGLTETPFEPREQPLRIDPLQGLLA